jgi:hypothetical protein
VPRLTQHPLTGYCPAKLGTGGQSVLSASFISPLRRKFFAQLPQPFTNAIIPATAFLLSTLTVPLFKNGGR